MTQEEKELLLKDLLGRVLYSVKVNYHDSIFTLGYNLYLNNSDVAFENYPMLYFLENIESVKPYLRPMDSMTVEEKRELMNTTQYDTCYKDDGIDCIYQHILGWEIQGRITIHNVGYSTIDWLNEHYFDYRGLIEKGLALKAPEDMYKF